MLDKNLPLSKPLQERFDGVKLAKPFYDEYIALCEKHAAYINVNYYGVTVVVKDGIEYPLGVE